MDFLQAMSNSAASTVSGPLDLLTLGLRKAGVPVPENAMGTSAWMEQKGLTKQVPQSAASLTGETLGNISPIVAAAKAPQIAAAALKAQENAAIPRQMNPQMGAIVYHGSPHKFDKFDSSKIGTGEGAQAYGHGMYLADSEGVAKSYMQAGARGKWEGLPDDLYGVSREEAERIANKWFDYAQVNPQELHHFKTPNAKGVDRIANDVIDGKIKPAANLYKVDLPDEAIAKMLDWDKPLSQQAPEVAGGIERAMQARGFSEQQIASMRASDPSGEKLHAFLGGIKGQQTGADVMRKAGIPGIRYLDGGSRGAGSGTSNYVVFPGNESLLRILERNGVPTDGW
jgi:hypothetical protein